MTREKFEEIVNLLNELLVIDREVISKLYTTRYNCSTELERHPKVMTRNDGHPTVSGLGALNSVLDLATSEAYRVGVDFDWEGNVINKFVVVEVKDV